MHKKTGNKAPDGVEPEGGNGKESAHSRFCSEANEQIVKPIASEDIFRATTISYFRDRVKDDDLRDIGPDPQGVSSSRDR